MLKILILPLYYTKMGGFSPRFCIFGQKFFDKKIF